MHPSTVEWIRPKAIVNPLESTVPDSVQPLLVGHRRGIRSWKLEDLADRSSASVAFEMVLLSVKIGGREKDVVCFFALACCSFSDSWRTQNEMRGVCRWTEFYFLIRAVT